MSQAGALSSSGGGGGGGIQTLAGNSGSATGSTVTVTGASTGLTTTGSGSTLTLGGTLGVANGGTGDASFTAYSVITGGTTSAGALQNVSGVGTSGQVLTSNGAAALPTWQNVGAASPAFSVVISANTGNVTGDSTTVTVPFDTVILDRGSHFNTGTNTYTFPVAGFYQLNTTIYFAQSGGVNTNGFVDFNFNSGTVVRMAEFNYQNAQASGEVVTSSSMGYLASANDTVVVTVDVTGSVSKNVILAGSGTLVSSCLFSGYLT
jgi:hypothetical protein